MWWSTDGVGWTQVTTSIGLDGGVIGDALCVVSGSDEPKLLNGLGLGAQMPNDLWCSTDGLDWRVAIKRAVSF
ncbi:MAG: hypothetical protein KC731_03270 [Myxococcales bacterium]|nr:hypothetical protein [Myxococcales bacterium]